jgi:hypothetical protein
MPRAIETIAAAGRTTRCGARIAAMLLPHGRRSRRLDRHARRGARSATVTDPLPRVVAVAPLR